MQKDSQSLRRVISAPMLLLYGMGNILGAGIYVLVGKVAGESGYAAPYAFLLASVVAAFTALSYSELTARYPVSAGEANYVLSAFRMPWLASAVGFAIVLSGLVSSAAILHGFAAYLDTFLEGNDRWEMLLALLLLGAIAIWGIRESLWVTAVLTVIELLGLLYVIGIAMPDLSALQVTVDRANSEALLLGFALFPAAFIAFYAFVGFEDIVNIAEEVKEPEKSMPFALLGALLLTTLVYIAVSIVAVTTMAPAVIAQSDAPLALIVESVTGDKAYSISGIALFAVLNGALVNLIMCSRVLYGLANAGLLPSSLARIHPRTRTPVRATLLIVVLIAVVSQLLPLLSLAKVTSFILLLIFGLVNAACWRVLKAHPRSKQLSVVWPVLGVVTCAMMLFIPFLLASGTN